MKKPTVCLLLAILTLAAYPQSHASIVIKSVKGLPLLSIREGRSYQSVELSLENTGDSTEVTVHVNGAPDQQLGIGAGSRPYEILLPEVKKAEATPFSLIIGGRTVATGKVDLQPVRRMTIYILPHSHNDIGYTEIQTNVERKQMNNLLKGMDYASRAYMPPTSSSTGWMSSSGRILSRRSKTGA
jgi:alpha-mannosidase